ncbi:hypothetical protein [Botrimarina sp.]|uniref:hypothetical protein n=1 Tax=Botrimarina sp. TaxID=2795802 RepID=UPI0032EF8A09
MLRSTVALAAALALSAVASAKPLNPERVSADAKWLAHVDLAALDKTQALKEARGVWPERAEKFRNWMRDTYGVDPREDLQSVTIYGTGYTEGDCAMVLTSDYSADKVRSRIDSQEDVKETEWRGHTIYTCKAGKMKHSSKGSDNQSSYGSSESKSGSDRVAWVLLDDNTIVYAKSKRGVKDAVETIEGHAPSLASDGADSRLTADPPEAAVAYAAAVQLDEIPHEGWMFPLLRQHERATYALGERDGELFDELKLVARNEQVAEQMKQVVEGYTAALRVSFINSEPITKMLKNVEVQQDGDTVTASWNGEVERFAQALRSFKNDKQRR